MKNGTQQSIINKFRPQSFDEVLGNSEAIRALTEAVRSESRPHLYLFVGGSGIGKTTLARIIAKEINASTTEIDVAVNGSVEDMRQLSEMCGFRPITLEPNRLYIVDEAHNLGPPSAKSWQPLLKLTEDYAPYNYFALCTTESAKKLPDAIQTRAYTISLKPLRPAEIEELVSAVADIEGWKVDDGVFQGIVQASQGSARRALSILQAGHNCTSKDKLAEIILEVDSDESSVGKLCSYLVSGGRNWTQIKEYLGDLDEADDPVGHATRYLAKRIPQVEEVKAAEISKILHSFTKFSTYDRKVDFVSGITYYLFGGNSE